MRSGSQLRQNIVQRLLQSLASSKDGLPALGAETYQLVDRALKPHGRELLLALGCAARRRPAAVTIGLNSRSSRMVSTAAPAARIGFIDLVAHVWTLRAPAERSAALHRLLALIGHAYLLSLREAP